MRLEPKQYLYIVDYQKGSSIVDWEQGTAAKYELNGAQEALLKNGTLVSANGKVYTLINEVQKKDAMRKRRVSTV